MPHRHVSRVVLPVLCSLFIVAARAGDDGLVIGTYRTVTVVDGDTFKIEGLGRSIRFLCIDTEETPKRGDVPALVEELRHQWPGIYTRERGESAFPIKHDSPFGYETAVWAKKWFAEADSVRLERDVASQVYDYYGRYLAYIIAFKKGRAVNFNVECVRLGYSPYSVKYGPSTRFNDAFVAAQKEAQAARRGIWNAKSACYPDYTERLAWWGQRGAAIGEFDLRYAHDPRYFFLGRDGEYERLALASSQTVVAFGALGAIRQARFPYLVELMHKNKLSCNMVFFETMQPIFAAIPWTTFAQRFVYVRGKVKVYDGKPEIVIESAKDISMTPIVLAKTR